MAHYRVCLLVTANVMILSATPALTLLTLHVSYPKPGNYSYVNLTCTDQSGAILRDDVRFLRDGEDIRSLVAVTEAGKNFIVFTFSPEQDGRFSCESGGKHSSLLVLAASPTYNTEEIHRHVLLTSPTSSYAITLSCPIKPGAVKNRYHFQWKAVNLHFYGNNLLLDDTSHSIHTKVSHSVQYQCTATVIHSEGQKYTYDGPVIHIHSHVLSITRSDDIHDLRLSREWDDKATLTCEFDKGDDITVYWIVDDECYECTTSPDDIEPEINGCFTEKGFSVFYLRNLTSFDEGKLSVKCVTQQGSTTDKNSTDSNGSGEGVDIIRVIFTPIAGVIAAVIVGILPHVGPVVVQGLNALAAYINLKKTTIEYETAKQRQNGAEGVQQKRRNEGDQPQGEEDVDAGQQLEPGNNGTQPQVESTLQTTRTGQLTSGNPSANDTSPDTDNYVPQATLTTTAVETTHHLTRDYFTAEKDRTRMADKDKDLAVAKMVLRKCLNMEELKEVFRELGLSDHTLTDHYRNYGVGEYAEYLLRAWINERDKVPNYGKPTGENLARALKKFGHNVAARKIKHLL